MAQTVMPDTPEHIASLERENKYLNDLLVAHALQADINAHRQGSVLSELIDKVISQPDSLTMDDLQLWKHFALLMEQELAIAPKH